MGGEGVQPMEPSQLPQSGRPGDSVVRGRLDDFGDSLRPARCGKTLEHFVPALLTMFNGDTRRAPVTHHCRGCCCDGNGNTSREMQVGRGGCAAFQMSDATSLSKYS